MELRALTDGTVDSTGTVSLESTLIGGVLITADGTNNATVVLKRDDTNGKTIFSLVTKTPGFISAPISTEDTNTVFYSVTGTNAAAQLYEWVD